MERRLRERHPAARALTGYLLVRGGVHQVAYARALENLTGAREELEVAGLPKEPTGAVAQARGKAKAKAKTRRS